MRDGDGRLACSQQAIRTNGTSRRLYSNSAARSQHDADERPAADEPIPRVCFVVQRPCGRRDASPVEWLATAPRSNGFCPAATLAKHNYVRAAWGAQRVRQSGRRSDGTLRVCGSRDHIIRSRDSDESAWLDDRIVATRMRNCFSSNKRPPELYVKTYGNSFGGQY